MDHIAQCRVLNPFNTYHIHKGKTNLLPYRYARCNNTGAEPKLFCNIT